MPFCTQCGHSNPEDGRFCSNCGAALRAGAGDDRRARPRRSPSAAAASRPGEAAREVRGALRRPTRRRSTRCRPARRCSSSGAGRTRAAGSCSTPTSPPPGRHPYERHLPRRRDRLPPARRVRPRRRAASRSATSAASTAPTSTGSGSTRPLLAGGDEVQIGKYRLVFYPSQHGLTGPAWTRAAMSSALPASSLMSIGEVLGAAAPGVPRRHHLQDPLPGVGGAGRAGAHAVRATASSPTPTSPGCATCWPTQRDHYLPLRVIKEHLDAIDRGLEPPAAPGGAAAGARAAPTTDGCPGRAPSAGDGASCGCPAPSCVEAAGLDAELLDQVEEFGLVAPCAARGDAPHYDADALAVATAVAEMARVRPRAAAPARLQDRRRPGGRPGRAGRRAAAAAAQPGGPGPRRGGRPRARRAVACGCTRRWCGPRLARRRRPALIRRLGRRRRRADRARVGWRDVNELDVVGVRVEMPSNQPIVLLKESAASATCRSGSAPVEATAIAFAQQGVVPPRPLTHDLLRDVLEAARPGAHPGAHHRAAGRRLLRRAGLRRRRRGQRPAVRRDRAGAAHRHADLRGRGGARRGRHHASRTSRRTRSRSSASSSTRSRPRTSRARRTARPAADRDRSTST